MYAKKRFDVCFGILLVSFTPTGSRLTYQDFWSSGLIDRSGRR